MFYTGVPICRNSSKIEFGKKPAFVSVFTVFLRGVRVVEGGYHIYIYIYVYAKRIFGRM